VGKVREAVILFWWRCVLGFVVGGGTAQVAFASRKRMRGRKWKGEEEGRPD
jgi:hypothetical protein